MTVLTSRAGARGEQGRVSVAGRPLRSSTLSASILTRANRLNGDESPWQAKDLLRAMWLTLAGLVGLGASWFGIGGEPDFHSQVGWMVGAIASVVIAAMGMIGWIFAGLREVHRATYEVVTAIRADVLNMTLEMPADDDLPAFAPAADAVADATGAATYVIGSAMTKAHRPGCLFVEGKEVKEIAVADIEWRGLEFCGVCCE